MGQQCGKGAVLAPCGPFVNLPHSAVLQLWKAFNLNTDGWGLTPSQFAVICDVLRARVGVETDADAQDTFRALFDVFDTDKNDIIDALEFLATIAAVSGMDVSAKMSFIFNLYDFSETGELMLDEVHNHLLLFLPLLWGPPRLAAVSILDPRATQVTLLMKSTVVGLAKISNARAPSLDDFENLARLSLGLPPSVDGTRPLDARGLKISRRSFLKYADENPTLASWLQHYDDLDNAPNEPRSPAPKHCGPVAVEERSAACVKAKGASDRSAWPTCTSTHGDALTALHASLQPTEAVVGSTLKPDSKLVRDWIYGYGSKGARNNAFYTSQGNVAYHAAEVGCLYTFAEHESGGKALQRHMCAHTQAVLCAAVSFDGASIATGDAGGRVVVWDGGDCCVKSVFGALHAGCAVTLLDFSKVGAVELCALDSANKLQVFDLASAEIVFSHQLEQTWTLLDLAWAASARSFVTVGAEDHVAFWTPVSHSSAKTGFTCKAGIISGAARKTIRAHTSVAGLGADVGEAVTVSGTSAGELLIWHGRNLQTIVDAHKGGSVTCLHVVQSAQGVRLSSAGEDRKVKVWAVASGAACLHLQIQIDAVAIPDCSGSVVACCLRHDLARMLIGTADGQLFEVTATGPAAVDSQSEDPSLLALGTSTTSGPLVRSAGCGAGVVAMAVSTGPYFATTSLDLCCIFETASRALVHKERLNFAASSARFTPDAAQLAVGMKGRVDFFDVSAEHFAASASISLGAEDAVSALRFTGDGRILGVAAGARLSFYERIDAAWSKKAECSTGSGIVAFDLAAPQGDELLVLAQVSTLDQQLLFFGLDGSVAQPNAAKDAEWLSQTAPTAYAFKGVASSLHACAPADVDVVSAALALKLAAVADPYGGLHLFPYPCLERSAHASFKAHGPKISAVAFVGEESTMVLSAGSTDGIVTEWRLEFDEVQDEETCEVAQDEDEEQTAWVASEDEHLEGAPRCLPGAPRSELFSERLRSIRDDDVSKMLAATFESPKLPWVGGVATPVEPKPTAAPNDDLTLDWVFGYSAQRMRQNVRYNDLGHVVYPAACLGIVLDKARREQKHVSAHTDEITAMATFGNLCATSGRSVSMAPKICVWDSADAVQKAWLETCLGGRAVSAIAFCQKGTYLAAVCEDDEHMLYIFDWRTNSMVGFAPTGPNKALCLAFSATMQLVIGSVDSFSVWDCGSLGALHCKRGIFGAAAPKQSIFSVAWVASEEGDETAVVGGSLGSVYRVRGRFLEGGEKLHLGPVTSMFAVPPPLKGQVKPGDEENLLWGVALLTGGHDGKVKLLGSDLQVRMEFDMAKPTYGSLKPPISSVCLNSDRRKMLIGTAGSEIYELATIDGSDLNGGPIVTGHCSGTLSACAAHPQLDEFATVGDDMSLRFWDAGGFKNQSDRGHRQLRCLRLEDSARALDFSPNGHLIAVGLGAENKGSGTVLIVQTLKPQLEIVKQLNKSSAPITCLRFSPDGNTLAAAAQDGLVYVYDCLNHFDLKSKCKGHSQAALHLDFSKDSKLLRSASNGPAWELLVHWVETGQVQEGQVQDLAEQVRDEEWASSSLPIGWGVVGAYAAGAAVDDVASVARDGALLATGDLSGLVRLCRWPAISHNAPAKHFHAHAANVSCVRFSPSGQVLASTGRDDKCLILWKRSYNEGCAPEALDRNALHALSLRHDPDAAAVDDVASAVENDEAAAPSPAPDVEAPAETLDWRSQLEAPSETCSKTEAKCPRAMRFVYGVPTQRESLGYNSLGDVVYAVGKLGVVYSKQLHSQKFYDSGAAITALAVSFDGSLAVSSDASGLNVWGANSGIQLCALPVHLSPRVTHCAFSPKTANGTFLAAVGRGGPALNGRLAVAVYLSTSSSFQGDAQHVATLTLTLKVVTLLALGDGLGKFDLVVGGAGSEGTPDVVFYKISGRNVSALRTVSGEPKALNCGAFAAECVFTGSADGAVSVWATESENAIAVLCADRAAHVGGVESMVPCGKTCVSGGSKDGWIKVWSPTMDLIASFSLGANPPAILALAVDVRGVKMAALTSDFKLHEIVRDSGAQRCMLQGSSDSHVASSPCGNFFASVGAAGILRVYDVGQRCRIAELDLGFASHAVAWSPNSFEIACGCTGAAAEGKVLVAAFDKKTYFLGKSCEVHNAKKAVTVLRFSGDGVTLAAGSADAIVYLYAKKDRAADAAYALYAAMDRLTSPVASLDFCLESKLLKASSSTHEIACCTVASGEQVTSVKDVRWATSTCSVSWETQASHASTVTSVSRSPDSSTLAVASHGGVTFRAYPASDDAVPPLLTVQAHAADVTSLDWCPDGSLITAAAGDAIIAHFA